MILLVLVLSVKYHTEVALHPTIQSMNKTRVLLGESLHRTAHSYGFAGLVPSRPRYRYNCSMKESKRHHYWGENRGHSLWTFFVDILCEHSS